MKKSKTKNICKRSSCWSQHQTFNHLKLYTSTNHLQNIFANLGHFVQVIATGLKLEHAENHEPDVSKLILANSTERLPGVLSLKVQPTNVRRGFLSQLCRRPASGCCSLQQAHRAFFRLQLVSSCSAIHEVAIEARIGGPQLAQCALGRGQFAGQLNDTEVLETRQARWWGQPANPRAGRVKTLSNEKARLSALLLWCGALEMPTCMTGHGSQSNVSRHHKALRESAGSPTRVVRMEMVM